MVLSTCSRQLEPVDRSTTDDYFRVRVTQHGRHVRERNDVVKLAKAPFVIHLDLLRTNGVFGSASWNRYYYDFPATQDLFTCNDPEMRGCGFFAGKTIAEPNFNEDRAITVADADIQFYWSYREDYDWHRLDREILVGNDGTVHASVTVEKIHDRQRARTGLYFPDQVDRPISDINGDIYIVFATAEEAGRYEYGPELQREKFILRFR